MASCRLKYDMSREISLTPAAEARLNEIVQNTPDFIRLRINRRGCAGIVYSFETTKTKEKNETVLKFDHFDLVFDEMSIIFIIGTIVDYVDDVAGRRFVFTNSGLTQCGCGQSFRHSP